MVPPVAAKPRRRARPLGAVVVSAAALLGACTGDATEDAGFVPAARDSAGVQILDLGRAPTDLPVWATVAPTPEWTAPIPTDLPAGAAPRVVGAATLSDGRVVVADAGSFRVRYHRGDETVFTVGGRGEGPGRFLSVAAMGVGRADTVWVSDPVGDKILLADPGAEESLEGRVPIPSATVVGRFGDGSVLLADPLPDPEPGPGLLQDSARYVRWRLTTGDTSSVGRFRAGSRVRLEDGAGETVVLPQPAGSAVPVAVGPGRLYLGRPEAREILGYDADATLRQILRLPALSGPLPEDLGARYQLVGADGTVPAWSGRYLSFAPERRPAFSRILLDHAGNLWLAEHRIDESPAGVWWVVSSDGVLRGRVDLPSGGTLLEAGAAHVLLVDQDQRVHRHRLER